MSNPSITPKINDKRCQNIITPSSIFNYRGRQTNYENELSTKPLRLRKGGTGVFTCNDPTRHPQSRTLGESFVVVGKSSNSREKNSSEFDRVPLPIDPPTFINDSNRQRCNKSNNICNNCGKPGHLFHQCKMPITSIGIVTFRINKNSKMPEYLLIRRKETLGYIDFMRGKYSVYNKDYIMNMLKQMTNHEKIRLCLGDFNLLWKQRKI
jgi:hypothetical protein